ncbi:MULTISPECIES: hypothetical protein [unclassified Micromonospora]|uniref:hypothetical protein n=1 Tax=unclassified Micromonospora TaxID=2617518 RepID=UPI001C24A3D3|nr:MULTISPECIES: hypothetical protein [unclassified Micromonospora]MBU8859101.1 hypothetical protein [Micromonospora sp. WMMB482]MDM4778609.1 hypothetical protein [Micromonospora sp. b486]
MRTLVGQHRRWLVQDQVVDLCPGQQPVQLGRPDGQAFEADVEPERPDRLDDARDAGEHDEPAEDQPADHSKGAPAQPEQHHAETERQQDESDDTTDATAAKVHRLACDSPVVPDGECGSRVQGDRWVVISLASPRGPAPWRVKKGPRLYRRR